MEDDRPYRIADCYSADRAGQECVQRKVDGSIAGYLINVEGHWEIEEPAPAGARGPVTERRAYVDIHEAALIVHMRGRAYQRSFDIGDPSGPFQIRLTPEGDERGGWIAGIWQAGRVKGSFCVAQSIEKAKYLSLQKLHIFDPISEYDLLRLSQENWPDVTLENPS